MPIALVRLLIRSCKNELAPRALGGWRQHLPRMGPREMLTPLGTYEGFAETKQLGGCRKAVGGRAQCPWLYGKVARAHQP